MVDVPQKLGMIVAASAPLYEDLPAISAKMFALDCLRVYIGMQKELSRQKQKAQYLQISQQTFLLQGVYAARKTTYCSDQQSPEVQPDSGVALSLAIAVYTAEP